MCELLGMSANVPTDICFSFTGLIQRGGITGPHRDGWGIVFYEGKGTCSFRDSGSSAHSQIAGLVKNFPIKSRIVVSHIRKANRGKVCLANTHPFMRELWGQNWTAAHNGQLKKIKKKKLKFYWPVGTTDSEHAFCWMLDQIRTKFPSPPHEAGKLLSFISALCQRVSKDGVFNLLMSDSVYLYAFCSTKLFWITRRAPFQKVQLLDTDLAVDFKKETTPKDVVTVIASQPLTGNETWQRMNAQQLYVFKAGQPISARVIS